VQSTSAAATSPRIQIIRTGDILIVLEMQENRVYGNFPFQSWSKRIAGKKMPLSGRERELLRSGDFPQSDSEKFAIR
jgi:hypothetical protein